MKSLIALVTVTLALGVGCGKKDKNAGGGAGGSAGSAMTGGSDTGSGSAVATGSGSGSGSAAAGAGSASGTTGPNGQTMAHRGGMCPSTVYGSTTTAELKDGKIVLAVTAGDKDAIEAIQKRTEEVLKEKTDGGAASAAHDQKGSHGGGTGICPVHLPEGATATSDKTDKGVTITITPKGAADALKAEIDTRIKSAADWVQKNVQAGDKGQGGMGGGSGNDGMNHSGQGDGLGQQRKAAGSAAGSGSAAK